MKKYQIQVDFGKQGYTTSGNLFKVIRLIIKENVSAVIKVHDIRYLP